MRTSTAVEHRAHVLLEVRTDAARLVVTNPIDGGVPARGELHTPVGRGGHGLLGIRERVASVRGTVEAGRRRPAIG